jgi:predicted amidohydrolase YtcJ
VRKSNQMSAKMSSAPRMHLLAVAIFVAMTALYALPKLFEASAVEPSQNTRGAVSNRQPADFVITNGKIYTEDSFHQTVEALAVRDGKIIFTGTNADAMNFIGPKTQVEDAGGRLVLPGLIDIHIHPMGIVDFGGCDLEAKAKTLAEIATYVRDCIARMQTPAGRWVSVSGWEYAAGNQTDAQLQTIRAALDRASTLHPIVMTGWDGHHGAYNSAALARAKNAKGEVVGYSKKTLETDFAQYKTVVGVDANGEPSGDIQDDGKRPIDSSEAGREERQKLLREPERLAQRLNSVGITAIQDASAGQASYEVYDDLIRKGGLNFRVNMAQLLQPEAFRDARGRVDWNKLFAEANAVRQKYAGNPLTRADAVKVFADGDLEANPNNVPPTFGASIRPVPYLQPIFEKDASGNLSVKGYVDLDSPVCVYVRARPAEYSTADQISDFTETYGYHPGQCAISYGIPAHAPAIFNEYIKRAHLQGYTIHVHTISEEAVRMTIDAIEAARKADGISSQPDTLAHVQLATPADVARMGRNNLYIAFTYSWMYAEPQGYSLSTVPFFDKVFGNSYESLHNPNNFFEKATYPAKTAKDAGAIIAAGSDAPVLTKDPQPFVNMELGVTRARHGVPPLSPWQRLNIRDLIDAYTINGARALNRVSEIGSLEAGKSADFIIVDQNILALADQGHPEKIGETKVLETWFMGKKVYSAPK